MYVTLDYLSIEYGFIHGDVDKWTSVYIESEYHNFNVSCDIWDKRWNILYYSLIELIYKKYVDFPNE